MNGKVASIIFVIVLISMVNGCSKMSLEDAGSVSNDEGIANDDSMISSSSGFSMDLIQDHTNNVLLESHEDGRLTVTVSPFISSVLADISAQENTVIEVSVNGEMVNSYTASSQHIVIPFSPTQVAAEVEIINISSNGEILDRVNLTLQRERIANSDLLVDLNDDFESIRSIDISGEYVVVGSAAQGTATILKQVNGEYVREQEITNFNDDNDLFGFSVAIDGNYLAVGAIGDDSNAVGVFEDSDVEELSAHGINNSSRETGAVYVWKKSIPASEEDNSWRLVSYVKPSEVKSRQYFGRDIEIIDHGNDLFTLAVAAPSGEVYQKNNRRTVATFRTGIVNVYSNIHDGQAGALELKQTLTVDSDNFDKKDFFGFDIDMNEKHLVVGAIYESSDSNVLANEGLLESGAAFVYSRNSINNNFGTHTFLKATHIQAGAKFGASVAVDGDTVFIGSPKNSSSLTGVNAGQDTSADAVDSGAVHVFSLSQSGLWESKNFIKAPNAGAEDTFGLSIHAHKGILVVASPREDGNAQSRLGSFNDALSNSGSVYVYSENMHSKQWENVAYLKSPTPQENAHIGIKNIRIHGDQIFVLKGNGRLSL